MRESDYLQVNAKLLQQLILEALEEFQKKESFKEEYLTRKEVAKLCKVSISTVSNWKNEGVLNAYGLGSRVYYKRSEIDKQMLKIN